ncbi:hypothetical protein [Mycobacterium paragordonae]|uniref:hypothetical protein n=1 Tax=Mycobacterium paragordonae TaxID=1389713 RepID=UPI0012E132C3|nr:hypothetical protein [Mycobacterium paragordonae]
MADAAALRPITAQRLRAARTDWGWSQVDLAAEVARVRAKQRLKSIGADSLRRQIVEFERGRQPGPLWRELLAEALREDEDRLFGLAVDTNLPRPLLVQTEVDSDVLAVILEQRAAHIRAEHLFGPAYARELVDRDLTTIEELIRTAPSAERPEMRRAAGRIAELGGWIAQDSGDSLKALELTSRAEDHLRSSDPSSQATVLMRRSNIVLQSDPSLAVELADGAARLIRGISAGRLTASIARQQALAAAADRDRQSFARLSAHAIHIAQIEPIPDDQAIYASPAYVAGEIASGLMAFGDAGNALDLLRKHHTSWPGSQRRDYAVASARLLRASIMVGDYHNALEQLPQTASAYLSAPSDRTRRELRKCRRLIRDRARATTTLPLQTLRRKVEDALRGDPTP